MTDLSQTLEELDRTNKEAFAALAELEACGPQVDPGALLGMKDWLQEQRLLIAQARRALQERQK